MAEPRSYRVFYALDGGDAVDPTAPVRMNLAALSTQLLSKLAHDGDFLGLLDERDAMLQVLCEGGGRYWVEIPCPERGGSFGARLSFDQVTELFEALPGAFEPAAFPAFVFEPWDRPTP